MARHDKDSEKESYCFSLSDVEPVSIVISFVFELYCWQIIRSFLEFPSMLNLDVFVPHYLQHDHFSLIMI